MHLMFLRQLHYFKPENLSDFEKLHKIDSKVKDRFGNFWFLE